MKHVGVLSHPVFVYLDFRMQTFYNNLSVDVLSLFIVSIFQAFSIVEDEKRFWEGMRIISPEEEYMMFEKAKERLEVRDEDLGKLPSTALRIALPNTEATLRVRKVRYGSVTSVGDLDPETGILVEKNQCGFGRHLLKCSLEVRLEVLDSLLRFGVVLMPRAVVKGQQMSHRNHSYGSTTSTPAVFGEEIDPGSLCGWNGNSMMRATTDVGVARIIAPAFMIRRPELHWWEESRVGVGMKTCHSLSLVWA